jgi:hypothetical protein
MHNLQVERFYKPVMIKGRFATPTADQNLPVARQGCSRRQVSRRAPNRTHPKGEATP